MDNFYNRSEAILKSMLEIDKKLTAKKWDEYAEKNNLFNIEIIKQHLETKNWEETKEALKRKYDFSLSLEEIVNLIESLNKIVAEV